MALEVHLPTSHPTWWLEEEARKCAGVVLHTLTWLWLLTWWGVHELLRVVAEQSVLDVAATHSAGPCRERGVDMSWAEECLREGATLCGVFQPWRRVSLPYVLSQVPAGWAA